MTTAVFKVRFGGTPKPALGTSALPGVLLALLLLISGSALAAGPLTAEIKPVAVRARTGAPETLDVKLTWSGSGLLEGALELSFPDADENAPVFRSHDLVLTNGAKDFRLMIPGLSTGGTLSMRAVRARFIAKSGVLDLGRFDFAGQRGGERNFTICVSRPKVHREPGEFALWRSLRLERFQPDTANYRNLSASTLPVYVDPEELPANPLAYTSYDLALQEGTAFTQLREKQLAALSRWVLAGGSLCVIADTPLEAGHRRFLTDLLAADPRAPSIDFDSEGRVSLKSEGGALLARSGFGRFVVAGSSPQSDADADSLPWKRAATFLWKLPELQVKAVMRDTVWWNFQDDQERYDGNQQQHLLAAGLAPKDVRILPYSAMLVVLGAFVLVIGPADWLVLGRFRLRRWTWVAFPVAAVAFTALTVYLANHYMGRTNYRTQLTVTDVGHDGGVLRETKFEMIFPARNQEVVTTVRGALYAPMRFSRNYYGNAAWIAPGHYEGLFPTNYTVRQSLSQWAPQLNRLTSMEPGEDDSGLDWKKLNPAGLTDQNIHEVLPGGKSWDVYTLHKGEVKCRMSTPDIGRDFVTRLCQPKPLGWLKVSTHFSPNGAGDFEDLALASEGDTDVSATIVVRREGANIHLYRHLYAP